jgi:hypothetical protein
MSRALRRAVVLPVLLLLASLPAAPATQPGKGPLKVFILAGQSNMEGHAKVETFDLHRRRSGHRATAAENARPDGKPLVCDGAWISVPHRRRR